MSMESATAPIQSHVSRVKNFDINFTLIFSLEKLLKYFIIIIHGYHTFSQAKINIVNQSLCCRHLTQSCNSNKKRKIESLLLFVTSNIFKIQQQTVLPYYKIHIKSELFDCRLQ